MSNQTFHYTAPDGSAPYGDTAQINGDVLFGGPGVFDVSATGMWFLSAANDAVDFDPGSNFDGVIMSQGGYVSLNGSYNFVTGSGILSVSEAGAGDRHNTIDVTTGVTELSVHDVKPTDVIRMHGFTAADISAAFAHAQPVTPSAELVTFNHAAGGGAPARSLGVWLTTLDDGHYGTAAQFHAV